MQAPPSKLFLEYCRLRAPLKPVFSTGSGGFSPFFSALHGKALYKPAYFRLVSRAGYDSKPYKLSCPCKQVYRALPKGCRPLDSRLDRVLPASFAGQDRHTVTPPCPPLRGESQQTLLAGTQPPYKPASKDCLLSTANEPLTLALPTPPTQSQR